MAGYFRGGTRKYKNVAADMHEIEWLTTLKDVCGDTREFIYRKYPCKYPGMELGVRHSESCLLIQGYWSPSFI